MNEYGLRTLGQVTRMAARDPRALARQFGAAGATLAALARGDDLYPFQPTPRSLWVRARSRFASEVTADQALAALPALAARLARRLAARGAQGHDLQVRVIWESGVTTRARRRLARPDALAAAAREPLITLLERRAATPESAVRALTLALGDLSARPPARPEPLFALPAAPTSALAGQRARGATGAHHRRSECATSAALRRACSLPPGDGAA